MILSERAKAYFKASWPGQMRCRQIFRNAWEADPVRVLTVTNPDEVTEYSGMTFRRTRRGGRRETGRAGSCPDCGFWLCHTFKSFVFRFGNPEIIEQDGVFRTDICLGHEFRGPLWLAGRDAAFGISARFREVWLRPFEEMDDGTWRYKIDGAFRADPEPGAVEPTYPDFLE